MFIHMDTSEHKVIIHKEYMYKIVYNSITSDVCHDIRQCELDFPRTPGKMFGLDLQKSNLNTLIEKANILGVNVMYTVLNFLPQQTFILCHKLAKKKFPKHVIMKTTHFTSIDKNQITRRLEGQMGIIGKNGLIAEPSKMTFYSEIYHKFNSNDVSIILYTFKCNPIQEE